ncbi:F-box/WD repeat-containing protein 10-like [Leptosomus discolor]
MGLRPGSFILSQHQPPGGSSASVPACMCVPAYTNPVNGVVVKGKRNTAYNRVQLTKRCEVFHQHNLNSKTLWLVSALKGGKALHLWGSHPPMLVTAVDRGGGGGQPPAMCFWPQNTDCLIQEGPDAKNNSPIMSLTAQNVTVAPAPLQPPSNVNQSKDFICCLPPHLSMYILGLLDQKSLNICTAVSRYWAFLVKEVKRERVCQSIIQEKILDLQGSCPRGAVSNYAKTVAVTIPQLNEEGDVIEVKDHNWGIAGTALRPGVLAKLGSITRSRPFPQRMKGAAVGSSIFATEHGMGTTLVSALTRDFPHSRYSSPTLSLSVGLVTIVGTKLEKEDDMQAAYRGLKTDTIHLEERNVFCGSYNTRVLMDQSDQSRVIHYSGGNLVAIGSADRKVRLLGMLGMKEVPPLLSGHAGSIKALFLNEKKGFVLSASFDLSIRCWNIYSGACVKIFNGHCGTITCLDLHKEQFVSGARDGMVKVWNLESGRCLRTLKHNSAVWVVKMDGTHVVSGCDRGLVKVWCADRGTLVKTIEGHQGPVKCLSFDQWHLVTGSTDRYVLGWSMLGNLKRCLIAFRHPKEVLSLEFLYLRVISGCADGKIRIFNYLTGSCLKVLMANSRGDPISSFYVAGNRMVINSPTRLLMFQFEDIRWDYTLGADREMVGKKNQRTGTPSQRRKRHDLRQLHRLAPETPHADQPKLSRWTCCRPPKSCGTSQTLCYEPMESAACQQQQHFLKIKKPFRTQSEQQKKLFVPGTKQPHAFASGKSARARSARIPADTGVELCTKFIHIVGGKSKHGPSLCAPAHTDRAKATWQHERRRGPSRPMSPDKFLLTVSMLQNASKAVPVSSSMKHTAEVREAWEPPWEYQQPHPEKIQLYKTPLQHKKDQTVQLQRARLHSDSLTMKKISIPFETKMLHLKLKNSLHGPTVNSSIPAPSIVRPKTSCRLLREKKAHSGHNKVIPLPEDGVHLIDPFPAVSELIKSTRVMIAQMETKVISRRKKPFCPYAVDPAQSDSGFRLLTGKQKEAYEAAAVAQCQAQQAKLAEDQQRACRKAWLRKMKGLPTDSSAEEGKTAAPELGLNTFI